MIPAGSHSFRIISDRHLLICIMKKSLLKRIETSRNKRFLMLYLANSVEYVSRNKPIDIFNFLSTGIPLVQVKLLSKSSRKLFLERIVFTTLLLLTQYGH